MRCKYRTRKCNGCADFCFCAEITNSSQIRLAELTIRAASERRKKSAEQVPAVARSLLNCAKESGGCSLDQSVRGRLSSTKQDLQDRPRVERAAPFEVEVGLQEPGREPINAARAEVRRVVFGSFRRQTRECRRCGTPRREGDGPPPGAGRRDAFSAGSQLIAASMGVGCSPAASRLSRCSSAIRASPVVAASRVFQIVSTRPAPTILTMSARSIFRDSPA